MSCNQLKLKLRKAIRPLFAHFKTFVFALPWVLWNYVMSERVYREDEIG